MAGTQLAKAYVQIVPSAQGIQGKIESEMSGPLSSAGSSGGKLMGSAIATAAVAASAAAAAEIGATIAKSISNGSELQQTLGGVETLFKDSAEKVKQNAAMSYQTTGMSANAYMEQTTSFAASLLQSLGGDTAKAADIADMAMRDMSDNSNKMGTDMERITDAYQGFAKQNYTMLDNLKLGYGGTKGEMERLLADAQELTGVEYNIDNLSDVYEAIHAVQDEISITGTTAQEASTTYTGSFNAMKAAANDLFANMGIGADITPQLDALAQTAATFIFDNLFPMIGNVLMALPEFIGTSLQYIFQAIGQMTLEFAQVNFGEDTTIIPTIAQGIQDNLPMMITMAGTIMQNILTGLINNVPALIMGGFTIITNLALGIIQNLPLIIQTASNLILQFVSEIVANLPRIMQMGAQLILQLVTGIIQNLPQIISSAAKLISTLAQSILQNLPQIIQTGIQIIVQLAVGLIQAIPQLVGQIPQIIESIKNAFINTDWISLGLNIISGIKEGLISAGGQLWDAVKGILGSFKENVMDFFGIHSPSRWGIWIGKMIDTGLAEGIADTTIVDNAMNSLVQSVTSPFGKGPLVSANYDLSGMESSETRGNLGTIIMLLKALLEKKQDITLQADDREIARWLAEMGVVFE